MSQQPLGISRTMMSDNLLLHYGFSSKYHIVKKYLMYKGFGQHGPPLQRLITEDVGVFEVEACPRDRIPDDQWDDSYATLAEPAPISYAEFEGYESWEDFLSKDGLARHGIAPEMHGFF